MALAASLHLRQSQSLVMTPQLMQSIRLLQLTHAELARFVEEEVERNPLLEHQADDGAGAFADGGDGGTAERDIDRAPATGEDDWFRKAERKDGESLADGLDTSYENVFQETTPARAAGPELAGQWKSMPGATSAHASEGFDLDDFTARPSRFTTTSASRSL